MEEKIEIHDMAVELRKIAKSAVVTARIASACRQGAELLVDLREIILTENNAEVAQTRLRGLLAAQGEG